MLGILLAVIFVGGFLLFGFNDNLKQDPKRFGLVVLALVLGVIALSACSLAVFDAHHRRIFFVEVQAKKPKQGQQ